MHILTILVAILAILLPKPLSKGSEIIVKHKAYTLSYNKSRNTPNWVAWTLTANHTDEPVPRASKFLADPMIPRAYRVEYYDYKGPVMTVCTCVLLPTTSGMRRQ